MDRKRERRIKKGYLNNYQKLKAEVRAVERQIATTRELEMSIKALVLTDLPKGGKVRTLDDYLEKISDLEEKLEILTVEMTIEYLNIGVYIEAAQNPLHRAILRDRYLSGLAFDEIAYTLNYSLSRILHLHQEAIDSLPVPNEW